LTGYPARAKEFLRAHPVICLLLLAPEVEYLTGSSQLSWIITGRPILFLIFLVQNICFYGSGVLLVREAQIRWRKGWATVFLLGAAYGVLEEGIGTGVLLNPARGAIGGVGSYGHAFGVNWISVAILVPIVHPLYSITLPILFFALALPEYRGKSLLSKRQIAATFVIFGLDVVATTAFVSLIAARYFAGPVLIAGCLVAIAVFVAAARIVAPDLLTPRRQTPTATPLSCAVVAAIFPWAVFVLAAVLVVFRFPAALVVGVILALGAALVLWVLRNIGREQNTRQKVAFAAGLVIGLIPMGISSQIGTGIGLLAVFAGDLVALVFIAFLWRKYRATPDPTVPPFQATPG
jgi:hypothetical protein